MLCRGISNCFVVAIYTKKYNSFVLKPLYLGGGTTFRVSESVFDWLLFGGDGGHMVYNTISRELLNNAYNPRFSNISKQAKQTMKTKVFSVWA